VPEEKIMATEDGGAVFPGPFAGHCGTDGHADPCNCYVDKGISLRDLFAVAALNGILASNTFGARQDVSEIAYQQADYMLKARAKAQKEG
jgi:hypothetical protein